MNERVFLISGGTSGIGLSVAKKLLAQGNKVMLMGRNPKRGAEALQSLASEHADFVAGDVAIVADDQKAVAKTITKWGRLDGLINSAGIYAEGAIEEMSEELFAAIMDTNVKGTYFLTQAAVPELKKTKGNIVNVASDAGVHGNYYCSAYCASKGAIVLFTKAMALELAGFGVRVNAVAPGDILTPMTKAQLAAMPDAEAGLREMASVYPLGRIGTPEEAAAAICFLASQEASFITGSILSVDGGLTA